MCVLALKTEDPISERVTKDTSLFNSFLGAMNMLSALFIQQAVTQAHAKGKRFD